MIPSKQLRKLYAAGYQLTPEAFSELNSAPNITEIIDKILELNPEIAILTITDIKDISTGNYDPNSTINAFSESKEEASVSDIQSEETNEEKEEKQKIVSEKPVSSSRRETTATDLQIISSPQIRPLSASAGGFIQYFGNRFDSISQFFRRRRDIGNLVTTEDLQENTENKKISLIGIVYSKRKNKSGSFSLELEDKNGKVTGMIFQSNPDLLYKAEFILDDSILCFTGDWNGRILFIKDVYWPDIPYNHKPNHSYEDVLALFISDIHVGSKKFAGELFLRAIKFLNGDLESNKYNKVGKKVKYLFVAGDVVEGVGIYPGQANDLDIDNIQLQYLLATEYFEQIRDDVEIIIIPGNHDAARAAEPQTPISKDFAPELYKLDNVYMLGSPAYVKAHNVEILMTHGNSIVDINSAIPVIPHETSIPAMVEMLKNRHLVPIYGKRTPIAPEAEDKLVITNIPDILHAGHTHITGDETYKGVIIINSGTFQYQTSYQKSMNINPTTGSTYIVNLQSLQRTNVDFKTFN
jgi:DNA polymerase II small subunit